MGYTHYWLIKDPELARRRLGVVLEDFRRLLPWLPPLAGPDGWGRPILDPVAGAAFNGHKPRDYESFVFDPGGRGLQFCKTGFSAGDRRPYDRAVTAFLLLAGLHMGSAIELSTDGYLLHWAPAARLIEARLLLPVDLARLLRIGHFLVADATGGRLVVEAASERQAADRARTLEAVAERLGVRWPYRAPYRVLAPVRLAWDRLESRRLFSRDLGVYRA